MSNLIQRYRHLGKANNGFKHSLDDRTELIEDILTKVVIESIRRYQQRLQVGIQDSVTDLLASFKLQIVDEIYKASQNWMLTTYREPILFPPECRYLYTLAGSTFVVIEQPPIVRTLRLDQRLFEGGAIPPGISPHSKQLAIPYTVFIIHFRNTAVDGSGKEVFRNLYIGWRSRPLSSLNEPIFLPYLPNIHPNYTVCTGYPGYDALESSQAGGAGISELTQRVITDFWNTSFNNDLSAQWYMKKTVTQLATVGEWERNSRENPLFILDVPLLQPTISLTLKELIDTVGAAAEERPETMDLRHHISEMTDFLAGRLFHGIRNYVFKTKFDRFYPKEITDSLAGVMETCAKQLHTVALGIEMKLNDIVEEMNGLRDKSYKWRKRGPSWKE